MSGMRYIGIFSEDDVEGGNTTVKKIIEKATQTEGEEFVWNGKEIKTDKGFFKIAKVLLSVPQLKVFKYENTHIAFIKRYNGKTFVEALKKVETGSIQVLQVHSPINIGVDGAKAIADGFKSLTCLALSYNKIGADGAKEIAKAEGLKSLTTLKLRSNNIGDDGAKAIATAEGLKSLTTLDLSSNNIGDVGAFAIAEGLKKFPKLESLDLKYNEIGSSGANRILESLETFYSLQTLDLSENKAIPKSILESIKSKCDANKNKTFQTPVNGAAMNSDLPGTSVDDKLGYNVLASLIVDYINELGNEPYSVGIYSPWGNGKSMMMNILQEKLLEMNREEQLQPNVNNTCWSSTQNIFWDFISCCGCPGCCNKLFNFLKRSWDNIKNNVLDSMNSICYSFWCLICCWICRECCSHCFNSLKKIWDSIKNKCLDFISFLRTIFWCFLGNFGCCKKPEECETRNKKFWERTVKKFRGLMNLFYSLFPYCECYNKWYDCCCCRCPNLSFESACLESSSINYFCTCPYPLICRCFCCCICSDRVGSLLEEGLYPGGTDCCSAYSAYYCPNSVSELQKLRVSGKKAKESSNLQKSPIDDEFVEEDNGYSKLQTSSVDVDVLKEVEYLFVHFNAWTYQGADNLWTSIVYEIFNVVEKHLGEKVVRNERLNIELVKNMSKEPSGKNVKSSEQSNDEDEENTPRESEINGEYEWVLAREKLRAEYSRSACRWILGILLFCTLWIVIGLGFASNWEYKNFNVSSGSLDPDELAAIIPPSIIFALSLLKSFYDAYKNFQEFLSESKGAYLQNRSGFTDTNSLGFMGEVQQELKYLFDTLRTWPQVARIRGIKPYPPKKFKLIIFIDDLDRCSDEIVYSVLSAINLLLQDKDAPVITILGIDHDRITKSVSQKLKVDGHFFLDKIINLPISLPKPNKYQEGYLALSTFVFGSVVSDVSKRIEKLREAIGKFNSCGYDEQGLFERFKEEYPDTVDKIIEELNLGSFFKEDENNSGSIPKTNLPKKEAQLIVTLLCLFKGLEIPIKMNEVHVRNQVTKNDKISETKEKKMNQDNEEEEKSGNEGSLLRLDQTDAVETASSDLNQIEYQITIKNLIPEKEANNSLSDMINPSLDPHLLQWLVNCEGVKSLPIRSQKRILGVYTIALNYLKKTNKKMWISLIRSDFGRKTLLKLIILVELDYKKTRDMVEYFLKNTEKELKDYEKLGEDIEFKKFVEESPPLDAKSIRDYSRYLFNLPARSRFEPKEEEKSADTDLQVKIKVDPKKVFNEGIDESYFKLFMDQKKPSKNDKKKSNQANHKESVDSIEG